MPYVSGQTLTEAQSAGASIDTLTLSPALEATPPTNTHTHTCTHLTSATHTLKHWRRYRVISASGVAI